VSLKKAYELGQQEWEAKEIERTQQEKQQEQARKEYEERANQYHRSHVERLSLLASLLDAEKHIFENESIIYCIDDNQHYATLEFHRGSFSEGPHAHEGFSITQSGDNFFWSYV
jgi:hypothetical protein